MLFLLQVICVYLPARDTDLGVLVWSFKYIVGPRHIPAGRMSLACSRGWKKDIPSTGEKWDCPAAISRSALRA